MNDSTKLKCECCGAVLDLTIGEGLTYDYLNKQKRYLCWDCSCALDEQYMNEPPSKEESLHCWLHKRKVKNERISW